MLEKMKAAILFDKLLKRPDINKAYAMVPPTDSWYDTITKVHNSLAELREQPHEDWQIQSHDGLKLNALYYPCSGSDKTMIWVHGYTSHAERESAFPALFYRSLGFNVLIPYLRAHGPSEGKYISFCSMEEQDIRRWVNKVNEIHPNGKILIHGLSMGGYIVLALSKAEMRNVKALIADAPSTSIVQFAKNVSCSVFKGEGEAVARHFLDRYRKIFRCDPEDYEAFEMVRQCRYPLFLSAGSNEGIEDVLQSLQKNNPQKTTVLILPGCNHGNGMYKQTDLYQSGIRQFLEEHISR